MLAQSPGARGEHGLALHAPESSRNHLPRDVCVLGGVRLGGSTPSSGPFLKAQKCEQSTAMWEPLPQPVCYLMCPGAQGKPPVT